MNNKEDIENKKLFLAKAGAQGRSDGIKYELALSNHLLSEHISNSPNSILNMLCRQKYGAGFGNLKVECLDMSTDKTQLSAKTRHKTTSKIDLSILCKKIKKTINFSIKKNASGFQFHITTSNRFFEIVEQKALFTANSSVYLINAFNKFLGVPGFSPKEMYNNGTLTESEYNKVKSQDRFTINELSKKDQKLIKDFFSHKDNVIKLVMIFLLGHYDSDMEFIDYIAYNNKNFNEDNQIIEPSFIYGYDIINYVKYQLENNPDFIVFNDTTIHFGPVFSIQRKGSGSKQSDRSGIQFKGKNLNILLKDILAVKASHPEYFELVDYSYEITKELVQDNQKGQADIILEEKEEQTSALIMTETIISNDITDIDIQSAEESEGLLSQFKDMITTFKNKLVKGYKAFVIAFKE